MNLDFLDTKNKEFRSLDTLMTHIQNNIKLSYLDGDLNIVGSICDYNNKSEFISSLNNFFDIKSSKGNLMLLKSLNKDIPYYLYIEDEFPLFFTTGRKTEDIPETIFEFIKQNPRMSRMWVNRTQMEQIRRQITKNNPNVIIPYFAASRNAKDDINASIRPGFDRTIQYHGDDGLETYKELKHKYGILPTNLKFEKPTKFKFRISRKGIFSLNKGGLEETVNIIKSSINRLKKVKNAIDTSGYSEVTNKFSKSNIKLPESRPWAIKMLSGLDERNINDIKRNIELNPWEFSISSFNSDLNDEPSFSSILIDENTFGKLKIRSKNNTIRIYPLEKEKGLDQLFRYYEFMKDQIDPNIQAITV